VLVCAARANAVSNGHRTTARPTRLAGQSGYSVLVGRTQAPLDDAPEAGSTQIRV
jgi:hypothetical protein